MEFEEGYHKIKDIDIKGKNLYKKKKFQYVDDTKSAHWGVDLLFRKEVSLCTR